MNPRQRQRPPRIAPTAISLAVLSALGSAQAQTAPASDVQTITIQGLRQSLESALTAKRADSGIVDVIKAEDIAKFPDTNLAESLQRVPGVVIDRDAGEGRNITVRGLGSDFTRVRINGVEALATTGGTDSSGGNNRSRGFDFNVFAAELFNSITVRKSASADVDEGSLGATVDLQTSRPFDFKDFTLTAAVQGRYNDLAGGTDPRMAFLVSNTFADRKLGVLLSGAYSKRRVYEEGFSTVRWDNGTSSGGWCAPVGAPANPSTSTGTTCGPEAQGVPRLPGTPEQIAAYDEASKAGNYHPRLPRYGRLTHDQDRLGLTGAIQVKPLEGTLLSLDLMYAKLKATRQEDFLQAISFSRNAGQGGKPQTSVREVQYGADGGLLYGVFDGVDVRAESRYDQLTTTFTQPTLTLEQDIGDDVRLTARVGQAKSKFRNPYQTTTTLDAINTNGYTLDFRGNDRAPYIGYGFDPTQAGGALTLVGVPQVASGTQPNTIPNTTSSEIRIRPQGSDNTNDIAHLSALWDVVPGALTLRGGLDYKKFEFSTFEFRRINQNDTIFAPTVPVASLTTSVTGFGNGQSLPAGTITNWVIPDLNAIAQTYDIYCNCLKSGPAGGPGDFTLSSITNGNARGNNRQVTETDTGGFAMLDFDTKLDNTPIRGNVGLRYVQTKVSATGYLATGGGTPVTVDNTYSDVLPALNVAANVTKDFIVRLGLAKVMARPQLGNMNPGGSISTTGTLSVTNGNPLLKPFRARTLDLSFEWYHSASGFLGVGLFEKNIDTYVQTLRSTMPFSATGLPMSLLPSNFTGEEQFQVTTPVNTPGGRLFGFEINLQQPFNFLPGIGKNFGVLLNYTNVQSSIKYVTSPTAGTTITDDLLNLSPESANATLYYDDGSFSARVSASRRSGFLTRVPGQNNNDVEGKNGSTNVDLSVSYQLDKHLTLTFEGLNLTNAPNDQFISRARDSVVVNHVTGREFMAGMRYKF